jgi:hypothetical protein
VIHLWHRETDAAQVQMLLLLLLGHCDGWRRQAHDKLSTTLSSTNQMQVMLSNEGCAKSEAAVGLGRAGAETSILCMLCCKEGRLMVGSGC